jgi:hypothetical protein
MAKGTMKCPALAVALLLSGLILALAQEYANYHGTKVDNPCAATRIGGKPPAVGASYNKSIRKNAGLSRFCLAATFVKHFR